MTLPRSLQVQLPLRAVQVSQTAARWRSRLRRPAAALAALGMAMALQGCAAPQASEYASLGPKLDLRQYFNGALTAQGLVTDRNGRLLQRFSVQITGRWQGDTGTLEEQFTYSDGKREQRVWTIQRLADGRYTGQAADVVGRADGQAGGPALNWRYTLRVPVDGKTWDIDFDDWMFQMDEQVMINRAQMRKFGITVGEVLIAFRKQPS